MNLQKQRRNAERPEVTSPFEIPSLPTGGNGDDVQVDVVWLWRVLERGKKIIVACVLLCVGLGALYCVLKTRRYEAVADLAIHPEASDTLNLSDTSLSSLGDDWNVRLETNVRILKSATLAQAVIDKLHLERTPEYAIRDSKDLTDNDRRHLLLGIFGRSLEVQSVPRTQVVEIRFRNRDPKLAADVVNALSEEFQQYNFVTRYRATQQASKWLTQQLNTIKTNVEDAQQRMAEYQKKTGIIGSDENNNIVMSKLDELSRQVNEAQANRIEKEAIFRIAESGNADQVSSITGDPHILTLKQQQRDLEAQLADAQTHYGKNYPKVVQLRAQLDQVKQSIISELQTMQARYRNEYVAAKNTEESLRGAFENQKQQAYQLSLGFSQYGILKREVESGRDLYEDLLKRLEEAGVVASLRSTNVDIVDPALIPTSSVEPRVELTMLVSLLGGIFLGVVVLFVRDRVDQRVGTPEEVEWVTSMPLMGIIPTLKEREVPKNALVSKRYRITALAAIDRPRSQFSEAFRSLRTTIRLAAAGAPPKTLLVTGSAPGEGKTTVSVNCATVLAQGGSRVLLVDADMRRGMLLNFMGLHAEHGLAECLAGTAKWREHICSNPALPKLSVLGSGTRPPSPADLLGSNEMTKLVQEWTTEYDHIIFDTPPVLAVTDALLLVPITDAAVVVVRHGYTNRYALRRTCAILMSAGPSIAGVVLNAFDHTQSRYYSGYGYYGEGVYSQYYKDDSPVSTN